MASEHVVPGTSLDDIDRLVHDYLVARGAYPTPLGYRGFPKSVCTSVNNYVLHGIPDDYRLRDGDVCKLDVSCFIKGVHGDNCGTFVAGRADQAALDLIAFTKQVLNDAIKMCAPGVSFREMARYIEQATLREGYTVNALYAGHGIGPDIHMQPLVMHVEEGASELVMRPGHVFTIEPAVSLGSSVCAQDNGTWPVYNVDGGLAAQEEHMVLVTPHGREVLTTRRHVT